MIMTRIITIIFEVVCKSHINQKFKATAFALATILFVGCSNDDNSSSPDYNLQPGLYSGELINDAVGGSSSILAIVTKNNNIRIMLSSLSGQVSGGLVMSGGSFTGTLPLFQTQIANFFHTKTDIMEFETNRTIDGNINATWTTDTTYGRIYLNILSAQLATPQLAEATWLVNLGSSSGATLTLTLTISVNGEITGSDTNSCVFNGGFVGADSAGEIEFELTSCGILDGIYTGAAILRSVAGNEKLIILASNDLYSFSTELSK